MDQPTSFTTQPSDAPRASPSDDSGTNLCTGIATILVLMWIVRTLNWFSAKSKHSRRR